MSFITNGWASLWTIEVVWLLSSRLSDYTYPELPWAPYPWNIQLKALILSFLLPYIKIQKKTLSRLFPSIYHKFVTQRGGHIENIITYLNLTKSLFQQKFHARCITLWNGWVKAVLIALDFYITIYTAGSNVSNTWAFPFFTL